VVRALAIPPAWTNASIACDRHAHLQPDSLSAADELSVAPFETVCADVAVTASTRTMHVRIIREVITASFASV
jgi:hypothetical protein